MLREYRFKPRGGSLAAWSGVLALALACLGCERGRSERGEVDAASGVPSDGREIAAPNAVGDGGEGAAPDPSVGPNPGADAGEAAPACSGICNAVTPTYPSIGSHAGQGNITMYTTEASNGGACNYGATKVLYFVAVNVNVTPGDGQGQWQGGRLCGQCVEVTALTTQGPQSVVVRIMDKCPDGYCGMDLGGVAPAVIMLDGYGRYDGSWRFVSCTGHPEVSDGPTNLGVSSGSNAYWSRVQIRNPPSAVESISWRDSQGGAGVFPYAGDPENTFEVPPSLLQSTVARITVTARFTDGSAATVDLGPGQLATENTSYVMK